MIQSQKGRAFFLLIIFLILAACGGSGKPVVTIETDKGKIGIELYPEAAPVTVDNFLTLIDQGFYDGLIFHRYVPGFVIQGGDPRGDGSGGPGWTIPDEFQDSNLRVKMPVHERGTVAMARTRTPNSAGSQFYICLNPDSNRYRDLEGQYTAFGRVIRGLDVVDRIRAGDKMNRVKMKTPRNYVSSGRVPK
ncbi:MAG: peptidylprolyl isomerase [Candidatus Poribacteria bacterium]|nr:peptidylprolyl isomerase [Candidatus Poribacteria bacterium]MDE0506577.1 peptidylprolyl isomerase [Candidatus Poribacteria bacterium]